MTRFSSHILGWYAGVSSLLRTSLIHGRINPCHSTPWLCLINLLIGPLRERRSSPLKTNIRRYARKIVYALHILTSTLQYLAKNNGSSNAYTSTSNTNYYFNVSTNALPGALERFAAFFHCPLFTPSCTSRELNAVDSEHKKNHQSDMWRIFQLNKHLSQPNHVWSKFGSGSRESLSKAAQETTIKPKLPTATVISDGTTTSPLPSRRASPASSVSSNSNEVEADGGTIGREVRRRLIEWWSEEYCSSRMRLCIIGKGEHQVFAEWSHAHMFN